MCPLATGDKKKPRFRYTTAENQDVVRFLKDHYSVTVCNTYLRNILKVGVAQSV
jgi:hypothetical protein